MIIPGSEPPSVSIQLCSNKSPKTKNLVRCVTWHSRYQTVAWACQSFPVHKADRPTHTSPPWTGLCWSGPGSPHSWSVTLQSTPVGTKSWASWSIDSLLPTHRLFLCSQELDYNCMKKQLPEWEHKYSFSFRVICLLKVIQLLVYYSK